MKEITSKIDFLVELGYSEEDAKRLLPIEYAPYPNDYSKEYYDIKTKDGKEYIYCYPNANKFQPLLDNIEPIKAENIAEFRLSTHKPEW